MASEDKAVLTALGELHPERESSVAKVKPRAKVKAQKWTSDDAAENLLAGLLDEAGADAEHERLRREQQREQREQTVRQAKERVQADKRAATEKHIAAERARVEEQGQRRTQMLAAIEQKRKVDSGEHDREQEQLRAAEEAQRQAEHEQLRQLKTSELSDAQLLIEEQQRKLQELVERPRTQVVPTKSHAAAWIALAASLLLVAGGGAAFWALNPKNAVAPDPYRAEVDFPASSVASLIPESAMTEVGLNVVSQSSTEVVHKIEAVVPARKQSAKKPPSKDSGFGELGRSESVFGRSADIVH